MGDRSASNSYGFMPYKVSSNRVLCIIKPTLDLTVNSTQIQGQIQPQIEGGAACREGAINMTESKCAKGV